MRKTLKTGLAGATVGALALALMVPMGAAQADVAPQGGDVVGVGSDTVQYLLDFGADGDPSGGPGYNNAGNVNRIFSFDATPDANARAGYLNGSTNAALKNLNPTIVLRAGSAPVQRPNGSGAGITALNKDTGATPKINFVRSSRLPTAAEQATAVTNGWGGLHVVQIATEPLQVAVANSTHAPAGLSVASLIKIYSGTWTTWNQVPGGTSTDPIVPLIPQAGSGTRSSFLADLQAGNGGVAITLASTVQTVEENDPGSITGLSATQSINAVVPFSGSRLALYNSGYFHDPSVAFPGGAAVSPGIKLVSGTPSDSPAAANYNDVRGLYIVFRDKDRSSSIKFQPGGADNWANALFVGDSSYFATFGQDEIANAGATPLYADKGNASAG